MGGAPILLELAHGFAAGSIIPGGNCYSLAAGYTIACAHAVAHLGCAG